MTDKYPLAIYPEETPQIREVKEDETLPAALLAKALTLKLTGLSTTNADAVTAADALLTAIGKLQAQSNGKVAQSSVGGAPAQVPSNQRLGQLAFMDVLGATSVTLHTRDSKPGDVWYERVSDTQLVKKFHGFDDVVRSATETYA